MAGTFPAIASILSPQALTSQILPGYNLGPISECVFYSGGFNHTYRIKTEDQRTYYIRVYRIEWRTLADILYELDVLNHLKDEGFSAAQPVVYEDGQFFCAVSAAEGTRYLALFTEAPGDEISYAVDPQITARNYGRAVAGMHNALDNFHSPHKRFHLDIEYFTDQPLKTIQPFLSHRPVDWHYLQGFAKTLRQHILSLPADALEQGFCHGDLQGYHASISHNGGLAFYDFDCGGYGYRAYDLAFFLWCCRLENAVGERWESFLNGYQQMRQINPVDLQAIPLFVCARYLWHMGVHTLNSADWGIDFLNDDYFTKRLEQLKAVETDYLI